VGADGAPHPASAKRAIPHPTLEENPLMHGLYAGG
jgi:hypothetical protein